MLPPAEWRERGGRRRNASANGCDQIMNVSDHTQRVFDSDLSKLTQMVAEMGGLAQKQVTDFDRRAGAP